MSTIVSIPDSQRPMMRARWLNNVMSIMPPIAPSEEPWSEAKPIYPQRYHYRRALVSITSVVVVGAVMWLFPPMRYSVIDVAALLLGKATGNKDLGGVFGFVFTNAMIVLLVLALSKTPTALPDAALREEKMFRAGAEDWSKSQRLVSNLLFGAIHIINLFVPLAGVLGLATGGWWFMRVYRQSFRKSGSRVHALQQSGAVHAAHNNLVIFGLIPATLVAYLVFVVYTVVS